jgi:hypothetical protein
MTQRRRFTAAFKEEAVPVACRSTRFQVAADLFRCIFFQPVIEGYGHCEDAERRTFPYVGPIRHVLANMQFGSDIEKRNRTLIAFTLLIGARDNTIASMRLKHIDLVRRRPQAQAVEDPPGAH